MIPCFNEGPNIPLIFKRLSDSIKRTDIEIILVNNGSTDQSARSFLELAPQYTWATVVTVEKNQGYGFGILQGLKAAKGDVLGWTHADMQTDPNDLIRAIDLFEQKGEGSNIYIKGHRLGRPWVDEIFTQGMSLFESIYLQKSLYDINAQPNLFTRSFYQKWENPPSDFALDLYALYMANKFKMRVFRFDVLFPARIHGESKWNTGLKSKWKFIRRTIDFSVQLKRNLRND